MPVFNERIIYYYKTKDNFPLSIKYAGITFEDKNFYIKRTNSNMYIYEYIVSGNGYLEMDNNLYKLEKGSFFIIPKGKTYSYYSDKADPFKKVWFCGDGILMDNLFNTYFYLKSLIIIQKDYSKDLDKILNALSKFKNTPSGIQKITNLYCSLMTKAYIDYQKDSGLPLSKDVPSTDDRAIFIKNYIDDNLVQNFNLEILCNHLHMTKVQLIRLFKKEYDITPYAYYLQEKFEIAENLITNTSMQIKEIAEKVGFEDEYYFSHTFKKYKGMSPTTLRKKKRL